MSSDLISDLIRNPSDEVLDRLFDDSESVFWVDWRSDQSGGQVFAVRLSLPVVDSGAV